VTTYDGERVTADRLVNGYQEAFQRFEAAIARRDSDAAFLGLFEALNWAVALDEVIGEIWRPGGRRLGFAWRDRVGDASVMAGVRYARNRVHHLWADAVYLAEWGRPIGDRIGHPIGDRVGAATFSGWIWRPTEDLPEGRPDKRGRLVYNTRLATNRADDTLRALSRAFAFVGELLVPRPERPSSS
jgi:hypothetical protein